MEVNFTVDTGATCTILANRIYKLIPNRPDLIGVGVRKLSKMANGQMMTFLGKASFKLDFGNLAINKQIYVADIEDDVLLGSDILKNDNYGPADILMSSKTMILCGTKIPLVFKDSVRQLRRITAIMSQTIPAMSQVVIEAKIENNSKSQDVNSLIVESTQNFTENTKMVLGNTLVNNTKDGHVLIRLMNPKSEPVFIHKNTVMGYGEPVDVVLGTLIECENYSEKGIQRCLKKISKVTDSEDCLTVNQAKVPSYLNDLYTEACKDKTQEECNAIGCLLGNYSKCFSQNDQDLGLTNLTTHVIETGNAKPIKQPPRRVPLAFTGEDKKSIDELHQAGVIRPSSSPWASPLVLVRKKDGKVRTCVDYRQLNKITENDAFPIPRTQDCLDALAGSIYFSSMDITSAYHQIPVREEDIPKTAFCSKYGLWEWTRLPFGLCSATATFQRTMELALSNLQWSTCLIYLDDVVVFGKTFQEHLSRLEAVLARIQNAGLKLKPRKCHFFQNHVEFLGHIISAEGIFPNPQNTMKVIGWREPSTVTEVRSYLGLCSYYRRFIKGFSDIAHPLIHLTKKGVEFKWTELCQQSFEELKRKLISPEIMAYPNEKDQFILDCDASNFCIGAVLSQRQGDKERVISYGSRTLSKAERNYCVTDRELLAVKYFVSYYRQYLLGRKFVVRTDHQALKWLFSLKEPKNRVARWIEILSEFDFSVEYRPGTKHGNADGMSRRPEVKDCECDGKEVSLQCGPCNRCKKRTLEMHSSLWKQRDIGHTNRISDVWPKTTNSIGWSSMLESWWYTTVAFLMMLLQHLKLIGSHIPRYLWSAASDFEEKDHVGHILIYPDWDKENFHVRKKSTVCGRYLQISSSHVQG